MSGIGPEEFSNVYNLIISTESAKNLVRELNKKEWWEILDIWTPVITSFFAATTAYFSFKITRNSFVNEIHKLYFSIKKSDDIISFCDYFEYVCEYYYKGYLKKKDLCLFSEIMKEIRFIEFAKKQNQINPKIYSQYLKWLKENNFLKFKFSTVCK